MRGEPHRGQLHLLEWRSMTPRPVCQISKNKWIWWSIWRILRCVDNGQTYNCLSKLHPVNGRVAFPHTTASSSFGFGSRGCEWSDVSDSRGSIKRRREKWSDPSSHNWMGIGNGKPTKRKVSSERERRKGRKGQRMGCDTKGKKVSRERKRKEGRGIKKMGNDTKESKRGLCDLRREAKGDWQN